MWSATSLAARARVRGGEDATSSPDRRRLPALGGAGGLPNGASTGFALPAGQKRQ